MKTQSPESWESCESDFLADISAGRHAAKRRRAVARRLTTVSVALALLAVGVWGAGELTGGGSAEHHFGGIACDQVGESLPALLAGELPEELAAKVEAHLRGCPKCREVYLRMQENAPPSAEAIGRVAPERPPAPLAMAWADAF